VKAKCREALVDILDSFSIEDGDDSEKVTFEMNSRFYQNFSHLFQFAENVKCRQISLKLIPWLPRSSLEKREKNSSSLV